MMENSGRRAGWRRLRTGVTQVAAVAVALAILALDATAAIAQETEQAADAAVSSDVSSHWHFYLIWGIALVGSIVALRKPTRSSSR